MIPQAAADEGEDANSTAPISSNGQLTINAKTEVQRHSWRRPHHQNMLRSKRSDHRKSAGDSSLVSHSLRFNFIVAAHYIKYINKGGASGEGGRDSGGGVWVRSSPETNQQDTAEPPPVASCFSWAAACCCSCTWCKRKGSWEVGSENEDRKTGGVKGKPKKRKDSAPTIEQGILEMEPKPSLEEIRCWGKSFDKLMKSAAGRNVFREFLRCEYSEENILFWLACEDLKKEANPDVIEEKARFIYEDYISILSPKEVSLDSRVREIVNRNMMSPSPQTFDEAQLQIYTLMHRDSYPRFVNSPLYKQLAQLNNNSEVNSEAGNGAEAQCS